jgi:mono/diheme cytochrome c family protein
MKLVMRGLGVLVLLVVVVVGGAFLWASNVSARAMSRTVEAHVVEFPVPFPLDAEEVEALELSAAAAERVALERALERGAHLVNARYGCIECHGHDFGGGTMVDAFPIGRLLGPNLTSGQGGVVENYSVADWDRIVRHGIRPDGRVTVMPSEDFLRMSDQELSDIIAYIRSVPPVDREMAPVRLGPLGRFLVATGQLHFSADRVGEHHAPHVPLPPPEGVSLEFGQHLAAVCTGCHAMNLAGGKIAGGDPSWVPAANLTPHAEGLAGWSYEDFATAMREARRPDGSAILEPMSFLVPFANNMTEVEMQALWLYLQSLEPHPTG